MNAKLAHDAADASQFPSDGLPEVAVMGRSNVGKSTFINALIGRKNLARTSARPGKTRRIHFYRLEQRAYLVDLPGYGYAAVGKEERRAWKPLVESYLLGSRAALRGAVLLVDARRGPEIEERELLAWLEMQNIPARLVITKADKLKPSQLHARTTAIASEVNLKPDEVAAVSGKSGKGLSLAGNWLTDWIDLEFLRADGTKLL
ncbi:MAG: YihA family ribosome biogenesis GTP-binding protein [bacterium]|nr:YihA family ribosome biogenesis GTP-binding protein [bacterium]